jgi:hypothetical protein
VVGRTQKHEKNDAKRSVIHNDTDIKISPILQKHNIKKAISFNQSPPTQPNKSPLASPPILSPFSSKRTSS